MIGIFDSGVGGLTVVKEIFKYLPEYQIIYFGDTARLPYGTKGADFVKKYSEKITNWLLHKNVKIIVIACNTASAQAGEYIKNKHKEVPIFDMINFAAEEIVSKTKNKKIGIIGTPGTIKSNTWGKKLEKLDPSLKIYLKACPLFVPMVEMGFTKGKITEEIANEYLKKIKEKNIDVLVLACTHYPLLKKVIQEVMGNKVEIINPAESVAKHLKKYINNNPNLSKKIKKGTAHKFFFSDQPYDLKNISRLCFKKKIIPIINDPFI